MWFVSDLSFSIILVHLVSILEKSATANPAPNYSNNLDNNKNSSTVSISRVQQALNIIDRLLQNYDARLRPHVESGQPENITVSMIIQSISSVSEANMDFTVIMHFTQTWSDPRLAYGKFLELEKENGEDGGNYLDPVESILVNTVTKRRLWEPDTFFTNERSSFIHNGPKASNENWVIYPDGTIFKSTQLTLTSTCPMNLAYFPMDHQICSIQISSYHFQMKELVYSWAPFEQFLEKDTETLPYFKSVGQRLTTSTRNKTDGPRYYSVLTKEIMFARSLSVYLTQVYSPTIMIVNISLLPLWLDPIRSIAERIAIGVTTILTLTTLITGATQNFPTVSYTKAIDTFTGTGLTFAFVVLLENVIVIWVTKKRRKEFQTQSEPESKSFLTRIKNSNDEDSQILSTVSKSMDKITTYQNKEENPGEIEPGKNSGMTPEQVDKKARVILPSLFWAFNIIYFTYYLTVSRVDTSEFTR